MVVRLSTPIASYSPAGTRLEAKVIGPVVRGGIDLLPTGSVISGKITKSAAVRFGVLRERAMLEVEFDECQLPDGTVIECDVALEGVDNAREKVRENRIQGVLAAGHMYSWLNGLWYRPGALLVTRSAFGLTGAGGEIYTHLATTPLGAVALITSEMLLYRLPDPEIELPAGTDLQVRVEVQGDLAPSPEKLVPLPAELSDWVAEQPEDVYRPDKSLAGDLIHLVFIGSRAQVEQAFLAAGWTTVQPLTRRSFAHMYLAFLAMKADPTAPIAPLVYRGNTDSLSFQKTLNTVAKRHHIRIWPASVPGEESQVWLAAATHDTTITLDERHLTLTHRIDKYVDRERSMVVNDLTSAGCVAGIGLVPRPKTVRPPGSGKPSVTDGDAALLFLNDCGNSQAVNSDMQRLQRRRFTLAMRRFFLADRQYVWRENPYYWAYRASRSLVDKEILERLRH
ncbi:MAG: LssY C-terminal domain-containing protein [Terriglobia bacterium]